MIPIIDPAQVPWEIVHGEDEHHAWYQRAFVPGDFLWGQRLLGNYVIGEDGRHADMLATPVCATCKKTPLVTDLGAYQRHPETGERAAKSWPPTPTDPRGCVYCGTPDPETICQPCVADLTRGT